jgi:translocation and assembly module TamB
VSKVTRYLIVLSLLLLALLAGGLIWLLFTPAGAETVLRSISRFSPVRIEAKEVYGRLAGVVKLTDVRVQWPQGEGQAQNLTFRWRPLPLLYGSLAIEELLINDGEAHLRGKDDESAAAPADFTFPEIDGLPLRLQGEIERLQVDAFNIRQADGKVLRVEHLQGAIAWEAGRLRVEGLDFAGSPGRLTGEGMADFVAPALDLNLQLLPAGGIGQIQSFTVQMNLQPTAGRRQLAGPLSVAVRADGEEPVLRLQSTMDWRPDRLALTDLYLTRPGSEGEVRGEGAIMAAEGWPFDLSLHLAGVDLHAGIGVRTSLFGRLAAEGNAQGWKGQFNLENRVAGWQQGKLAGTFAGNAKGIDLADLQGEWLQGNVQGTLAAGWSAGWQIEAALTGRNLQPAAIVPEWPGRINFDLHGMANGGQGIPPVASIDGNLRESTLRGRALTGSIAASMQGEDVRIERLALRGDGFNLHAAGKLLERIDFRADITRLAGLLPDVKGSLRANGWLRRRQGILRGEITAQGENVAWRELLLNRGSLRVERREKDAPLVVKAELKGVSWREYHFASAALQAKGSIGEHRLQLTTTGADLQLQVTARGGYAETAWRGELLTLKTGGTVVGKWTLTEPASVQMGADRLLISALRLAGEGEEFLSARGDLTLSPLLGWVEAEWRQFDLSRGNPWLPEVVLAGRSSGSGRIEWLPEARLDLRGQLTAAGSVTRAGERLPVRQATAQIAWGAAGLQASWAFDLSEQGHLAGEVTSDAPARLIMPERGRLRGEWEKIDLAVLRPWLPGDLLLVGSLAGEVQGEWFPDQRLRLTGEARVVDGDLEWQNEEGTVTAAVQQARLRWNWQDEALAGELQLKLENFGQAVGSFRFPLPARWPVAIEPAGPVQAQLQADLQEEGLLNSFLPGLVQESRGKLELALRLGGTWQDPVLGGDVRLHEAAAYLPTAGIRVEQVELTGKLDGQEIEITSLQLRSGEGRLEGEGRLQLNQWRLDTYQLHLRGERFRAIHLPEWQLQVSPDLQLSGTTEKLTVRGDLRIPSMLVTSRETDAPIKPSSDIVIVDAPQAPDRKLPLLLDIRVRIILGQHVLVKDEGIDARLEGSVLLTMAGYDPKKVMAQGEIKVAQGKYSTYGVSLDITRGNILFAGGPVDRPTLDIQALRTVGEVKAGVKVTGTPREPRVALFSEPAMTDTDVLAYIVLGHPIGQEGGANAGLLMLAANALLSKGESAVLQDRLKRTFGLDVLEIESGDGDANGSQITIGKYLNPDLYVSFGQSLFANTNEVRMRYNLSRRWQIESSMGEQSAVDLYYKIEFR